MGAVVGSENRGCKNLLLWMYFPTGQAKGIMIIVFQQKVMEDIKCGQSLIIHF